MWPIFLRKSKNIVVVLVGVIGLRYFTSFSSQSSAAGRAWTGLCTDLNIENNHSGTRLGSLHKICDLSLTVTYSLCSNVSLYVTDVFIAQYYSEYNTKNLREACWSGFESKGSCNYIVLIFSRNIDLTSLRPVDRNTSAMQCVMSIRQNTLLQLFYTWIMCTVGDILYDFFCANAWQWKCLTMIASGFLIPC